jgi:hypothetical protein
MKETSYEDLIIEIEKALEIFRSHKGSPLNPFSVLTAAIEVPMRLQGIHISHYERLFVLVSMFCAAADDLVNEDNAIRSAKEN